MDPILNKSMDREVETVSNTIERIELRQGVSLSPIMEPYTPPRTTAVSNNVEKPFVAEQEKIQNIYKKLSFFYA